MTVLFRVIYAAHSRSTHHKLALDALRTLHGEEGEPWRRLFLKHHQQYLLGAKAPDTTFKDFTNHVVHVSQNHWGGAAAAAREWYDRTTDLLRRQQWGDAVYAAGVLSHYYTDPIQPLHTGQSDAENNIHRALEWSVAKSYEQLRELAEFREGRQQVVALSGDSWVEKMVLQGAELAHRHYDTLVAHYDFARGVQDPPAGLDQELRHILARLLGYASMGFGLILQRAVADAAVAPPDVWLTLDTFLATLQIPIRWVAKRIADAEERTQIEAMYYELKTSGRVVANLAEDDRIIRDLSSATPGGTAPPDHRPLRQPDRQVSRRRRREGSSSPSRSAERVQRRSASHVVRSESPLETSPSRQPAEFRSEPHEAARPAPPSHSDVLPHGRPEASESPSDELKFYLERSSEAEAAPSIGRKTARRLAHVGVRTVADLLAADPHQLAKQLNLRHIKAATVRDWQDQATLVCRIPRLRGHDAQILVACGFRSPEKVAVAEPGLLFKQADQFAESPEGQRTLRSAEGPGEQEVANWIRWARRARPLRAA